MNNHESSLCRPTLSFCSAQQLDELHAASLRILAKTGINVHLSQLRTMLGDAGAEVKNNLRVFIPETLIERCLATAPSRISVHDRRGNESMVLKGTRSYYGTGSDLKFTLDTRTNQRRCSTLEDVTRSARLCDRLKNIDFVMSYGLPGDVPDGSCETEQFRTMLDNTDKPIIMTIFSGVRAAEQVHELACSRSGGDKIFREKPSYVVYGQFVSPLQHDTEALNRLTFCADRRIPFIYVPTIMMGASGPATLAGALALANAECLAGLVMHQLCSAGAPFIYGGCVSPLDMKTTVFGYGAPEWRLADAVLSQLSQRYDLPVFGTAGATDAITIDAQAGAEWAYSLLMCALAGTSLIHDVGYMESGLTGSLEALVLCDETIAMVKQAVAGFEISDETLALDTIHGVGPGGHFMEEEHTLRHFRKDIWYPSLFVRERFDTWQERCEKDLLKRAKDRVAELMVKGKGLIE